MSYQLILKPSAAKQAAGLPRMVGQRVLAAMAQLEANPRGAGSVKLSGSDSTYRVRVGDWRIVYEVDDRRRVVFVTIVAHRRDVYRGT